MWYNNQIMTKGSTAIILSLMASVLALMAILVPKFQVAPDSLVLSGVTQGNEYFSTTTRSAFAGVELTNLKVLKNGSGALGSVIVTGPMPGVFTLYDSTSTITNTEWATTTLATFGTSTPAGTYTFDVNFSKGLLFEESGTVASSTITWR
jgi:hypothetical protein